MLPAATELVAASKRRSLAVMAGVGQIWDRIDPAGDWSTQWIALLPRATALVSLAQVGAATDAAAAVPAMLTQQGVEPTPIAELKPSGFAGWAVRSWTNGDELVDLGAYLYPAVITARQAPGGPAEMLQAGRRMAQGLAQFATASSSDWASRAGATADRGAAGLVWYDPPPMCQRCAAVYGRFFRFGAKAFQRHPRCDGQLVAVSQDKLADLPMIGAEDVKDLNRWQKKALSEGADWSKVINSTSGVQRSRGVSTSVLTDNGLQTYYGAGRQKGRTPRLSPKGVFTKAGDNRELALRLLRDNGYIQ